MKMCIHLIYSAQWNTSILMKMNQEISNKPRIGSYHVMTLAKKKDGNWLITKEWYNDPFADSLDLENIKINDIKQHIISQPARDME